MDATTTPEVVPPEANTSVAQTEVPVEAGAVAQPETAPQLPPQQNGIQARIDELTREKYEARRAAEAMQQQNAELMNNYARLLANQVEARHAPAEPEVEIDPATKKLLDQYLGPKFQHQEQTIRALQKQLAQTEYQQVASKFDPLVQARAADLLRDWESRGMAGWTHKDALIYAQGELGSQIPRDTKGRFAAPQVGKQPETLTRAPAAAPVSSGTSGTPDYVNPASEHYDANKALAFYEKTLDGKVF